jgi:hypothetical protein
MQAEFLIIDRFEGDLAVCEVPEPGSGRQNISRDLLPSAAKEGDLLRLEAGKYVVDYEQTALKRQKNAQKLAELLNRKKKN